MLRLRRVRQEAYPCFADSVSVYGLVNNRIICYLILSLFWIRGCCVFAAAPVFVFVTLLNCTIICTCSLVRSPPDTPALYGAAVADAALWPHTLLSPPSNQSAFLHHMNQRRNCAVRVRTYHGFTVPTMSFIAFMPFLSHHSFIPSMIFTGAYGSRNIAAPT